ncbi:dTDP-4-dehydrorhamnose reductase [methane-oxidizing endosymbiont of Gigantopelta aegis]|uniref:dTDP-4-dehydrorhamnose reductase n=1 Tax=methane-oxidizing endosymbiont of Gigantopelta aegis TaxID=2794938 RepID=UPI0018DCFD37|nr:dTDP-4-dehydrorhamnose reductase [methane-oxidizing endosymbiont of Gigantopelta aegis]
MKIIVTGCQGQVGQELIQQAQALHWDVIGVNHQSLDITDLEAVNSTIKQVNPDAVVNAAAYTAVDKAETEKALAFAVNRDGPKNLAKVCSQMDIPLLHYSTDYVFDGRKTTAYAETDTTAPLGVYGESKLAGEHAIVDSCKKYLIFRTSWVFSVHGSNFVKTMLKLGAEREELGIVADQFGKPTSASEIARISLHILQQPIKNWGIYHLAQPDPISWHGFAQALFKQASDEGMVFKLKDIRAITTADYPTPAKRPVNSVLDCQVLEQTFKLNIRPWRESLAQVIKELVKQ